jgi:hypothetical protein
VARTARNPIAWSLSKRCGRLSDSFGCIYGHGDFTRKTGERDERLRRLAREMFPEMVAGAPFRGMRYPSGRSFGRALLPKLLGSYESELHPLLEAVLRTGAPPSSTSDVPRGITPLAWDFVWAAKS